MDALILHDCTAKRAQDLVNEIGKVRAWLTGFQAAGKAGPPGEDSLRQVQVMLKHAIDKASIARNGAGEG